MGWETRAISILSICRFSVYVCARTNPKRDSCIFRFPYILFLSFFLSFFSFFLSFFLSFSILKIIRLSRLFFFSLFIFTSVFLWLLSFVNSNNLLSIPGKVFFQKLIFLPYTFLLLFLTDYVNFLWSPFTELNSILSDVESVPRGVNG